MGRAIISPEYTQLMARYNRWMNGKLYVAADRLSDETRKADRQAFFSSIHSPLNHLVWGDGMWLERFTKGTALEKSYSRVPVG